MKYNKTTFYFTTLLISLLIIAGVYYYFAAKINSESVPNKYGTCKTPEEAYKQTQLALNLLSVNINSGIKNAQHINEYEKTKNKVFKIK
ncbi:MAG: hypothetical protein QM535_19990 [Limnohabitans sp.]|nr:hypothetical protein [Limnohabitans sp.]